MLRILLLDSTRPTYTLESILSKPVRGSEQAFVYLYEALRERPDVSVHAMFADSTVPSGEFDLCLVKQRFQKHPAVRARRWLLWSQYPCQEREVRAAKWWFLRGCPDAIIVSTDYHERTFRAFKAFQGKDFFLRMDNGIPEMSVQAVVPRKNWFIYASAPHRGLEQLTKIWPAVHERLPDYELHVCGGKALYRGTWDQLRDMPEERREAIYRSTYEITALPGVVVHEDLSRDCYVKMLSSAQALLYPCQNLEETSCITVHEAMALGCVPVVSSAGALKEVVQDGRNGVVVDGIPKSLYAFAEDAGSAQFRQTFVEAVVEAVSAGQLELYRSNAITDAKSFVWNLKADELLRQGSALLQKRRPGLFTRAMRFAECLLRQSIFPNQ